MMFEFTLVARSGRARVGVFRTPHGEVLTPVFAPVGTAGTVKALTPAQLKELGASIVLSNTYHLYLRPGDELGRDLHCGAAPVTNSEAVACALAVAERLYT